MGDPIREAARAVAENVEAAYHNDVRTGSAPGLTLADLIEVAIAEAVESAGRAVEAEADLRRKTEGDLCEAASVRDRLLAACQSLHRRWAEAMCREAAERESRTEAESRHASAVASFEAQREHTKRLAERLERATAALADAATSLETASRWTKDDGGLSELRQWAASRATVARKALGQEVDRG